jgi:hypothetical protein
MRIFISHSSTDKWVARQISTHLEERGLECFLDEKDIETGDSINGTIQENLGVCDELLLLLSPASLKSAWVLIELGGAKALDKRLVPILLHVGPNDLPDVLSDELARDINEIERYYDEVQQRNEATAAEMVQFEPEAAPPVGRRAPRAGRNFSQDDRVRLPREVPASTYARDGSDVGWNPEMERYLGMETTVRHVIPDMGVVQVAADEEAYYWLMDWLDPASDSS